MFQFPDLLPLVVVFEDLENPVRCIFELFEIQVFGRAVSVVISNAEIHAASLDFWTDKADIREGAIVLVETESPDIIDEFLWLTVIEDRFPFAFSVQLDEE